MIYLRLYENMTERNNDQGYRSMQKYYVGYTPPEDQLVEYNMSDEEKEQYLINMPLTFKIQSNGNINWFATTSYVVTLEYSKNGGPWTEITSATGNGTNLSVVSGDTVQFRGNSPLNDGTTWGNCNYFRNTCSYSVEGNIMSLLNKTDFNTMTDLSSYNYAFYDLFYSNTGLTDASNLILPAMTLSSDLTYGNMFASCTNLTTAPTLPATTLTPRCYWHMFRLASKLNYIKCLAVDKSASNCVLDWVYNVALTGTFIKNPEATWSTGTSGIPTGWLSYNDGLTLLTGNKGYFSLTGGTNEIVLTSSVSWTATTTDSWITFDTSTGEKGNTTITINVSSTSAQRNGTIVFTDSEGNTLIYSVAQTDVINQPLTFNVQSDGNINWKANNTAYTITLEYSKDNGSTWNQVTSTTGGTTIPVVSGDTVQFRGNKATLSSNVSRYNTFSGTTAQFSLEGNIMSLINSTNFSTMNALSSAYTFNSLFFDVTGLTDITKLILPATILTNNCYYSMFHGCTNITQAPELPAITLTNQCYFDMFNSCASLTVAPELPATVLSPSGYSNMFAYCTSLTQAPELPATTVATHCYSYMFYGCTSLTTAPELPATTLTRSCYEFMFYGCTGLTSAPELLATVLGVYCYGSMFQNCTNLNYIKCLATDKSATGCVSNWVSGVASTGTFVKSPSITTSTWGRGVSGIPTNWTVQDA